MRDSAPSYKLESDIVRCSSLWLDESLVPRTTINVDALVRRIAEDSALATRHAPSWQVRSLIDPNLQVVSVVGSPIRLKCPTRIVADFDGRVYRADRTVGNRVGEAIELAPPVALEERLATTIEQPRIAQLHLDRHETQHPTRPGSHLLAVIAENNTSARPFDEFMSKRVRLAERHVQNALVLSVN
jgi:hypothetical protein